jgi:hydrogenase expression/formation protein HypE
VSGDIGRHGIAVMAARQGLSFETPLESDSAQVWPSIRALLDAGIEIKCMRDLTRGGLGAALSELAGTAGVDFTIDENEVPVGKPVAAACEILGIDPLFVANEGRFTAVVPAEAAETAVAVLKREHEESGIIGEVLAGKGRVHLRRPPGITRYLLVPAGDQLPRIC